MAEKWQLSLKKALRGDTSPNLKAHHEFNPVASKMFSHVITEQISKQVNWDDSNDPLLLQFLPHKNELEQSDGFSSDPVGDHQSSPIPGLIHKYHGRVLLIASGSCAVNCRYCFRRHFPYEQSYAPRNQWQSSVTYINDDPSIHEVILSGGDPLTLNDKTLQSLSDQLEKIPHVKTLRIHSRIPVVLPNRIDQGFSTWANQLKFSKVMVLHINHANEISTEARHAIRLLKSCGFTLLNQSVLLKSINDSSEVLIDLSHQLFELGIMPYYLHLFDQVENASHFDLNQQDAIRIYRQIQNKLPGYLLPKLVKEKKGQPSKTIINLQKTELL